MLPGPQQVPKCSWSLQAATAYYMDPECHINNGCHISPMQEILLFCKKNQLANYIKAMHMQNPLTYFEEKDVILLCCYHVEKTMYLGHCRMCFMTHSDI